MKMILVPLDFSDVTPRLLEHAAVLAEQLGTRICLLHVAPPEPDFLGYDPGPDTVRDAVAHSIHDDRHHLEEREKQIAARGINVMALQVQGPTVDKILQEADRLGADMIVMGSHGHGALYELIVGSVTEGVLREASCPVLVVPSRAG